MTSMTTENTAPLPASAKALKSIAEANSWVENESLARANWTKLAWRLVAVFVILAVMGWTMAMIQMLKPLPPPVRIIVDRTTGESMVVGANDEGTSPLLASDQHWVAEFVKACDSYHFALLKTQYDQCARMSAPDVFSRYSALYQGDKAKQTVVGSSEDDSVSLVSVRMTTDTKPGQEGVAIATYDKVVTSTRGLPPVTSRFVETLRWQYIPQAMKTAVDRLENPQGFVVLGKQSDQELVAPPGATPSPNSDKATFKGGKA